MKIKEAIKQYEEHIQYRLSVEDCNAIDTIIEAIEYYESQDIISRTDAIFCSEDLYKIYEKTINSIPKAEYRGDE